VGDGDDGPPAPSTRLTKSVDLPPSSDIHRSELNGAGPHVVLTWTRRTLAFIQPLFLTMAGVAASIAVARDVSSGRSVS